MKKKLQNNNTTFEKKARPTDVTAFVGINGTGKTTLVKEIIKGMTNRRTLVVQYAGLEEAWDHVPVIDLLSPEISTFTGIRQCYFARYDAMSWKYLFENYQNGNLIFDDCKNYIDPLVDGPLLRLLINRRQLMIDIYFMVHSFNQLPVKFYDYCVEYFIFKTLSSPEYAKKRLDYHYKKIEAACQRVNLKAGNNPDAPSYHTFEYIRL